MAKSSLWFFAYHCCGYQDIETDLHRKMCSTWQARLEDPYTLWLVPRSHLKSSLWSIAGTLWELARNPDLRFLVISATVPLAEAFLLEIRSIIENNETFRWLFPEYTPDSATKQQRTVMKWTTERIDLPCSKWLGRREGSIEVMSEGKNKTGRHYDRLVFDDALNADTVSTKEVRDKSHAWFLNTFQLRDNIHTSIIRVIGTRWHFDDWYGRIIQKELTLRQSQRESKIPVTPQWKLFRLGCFAKDDDGNRIPIWPYNDETKHGFTVQQLDELKAQLGSYIFSCNPGHAPVLMADYSQKPISEVVAGDMVMGFRFNDGERPRLVPTKVIETKSRVSETVFVHLDDGMAIECTPDHRWFTGRFGQDNDKVSPRQPYKTAKVGRSVVQVYRPNRWIDIDEIHELNYLAGIIDGEGSVNHGQVVVTQSAENNGAVCSRIERCLNKLKVKFSVRNYYPKPSVNYYIIEGDRSFKINLLSGVDLGKKEQVASSLHRHEKRIGKKRKVTSVEPASDCERVHSMQTETGNYIVWGLASKNCQYENSPVTEHDAIFKLSDINFIDQLAIPLEVATFMAIDLSDPEATSRRQDYTVITVASFDSIGRMFVREMRRAQNLSILTLYETIYNLCVKWNVLRVAIETNCFQRSIVRGYQHQAEKKGWHIPWIELKRPSTKSKAQRIIALQPRVERGHFFIQAGMTNAESIVTEMTEFPLGTHDDILDTLADLEHMHYAATPKDYEFQPPPNSFLAIFGDPFEKKPEWSGIPDDYVLS